jgi:hypothetical protein
MTDAIEKMCRAHQRLHEMDRPSEGDIKNMRRAIQALADHYAELGQIFDRTEYPGALTCQDVSDALRVLLLKPEQTKDSPSCPV